jgi:hypothetical protein
LPFTRELSGNGLNQRFHPSWNERGGGRRGRRELAETAVVVPVNGINAVVHLRAVV